MKRRLLSRAALGITMGAALGPRLAPRAFAQDPPYPKKMPIEITCLFPAGSSADLTARLLADGMAKQLASAVLVFNRPGAGGAIGYRHVAAQKPDGYALVWNSNSISTTFHSGQLGFDYRAFEPVARVLVEAPVVVVRADSKWKSLGDLVQDARARPETITVGNSGVGSHTHIAAVALFQAAGARVIDVPYAAAQVIPNLLGGHVDVLVQLPGALAAPLSGGALRALAALTTARDPALPDVPTAREQGIDAALEAWRGVAAPKGTPKAVIASLEEAIRKTVAGDEFVQGSVRYLVRPAFLPAERFGELIAAEDAELAGLMSAIGLKKS